jgi:hypothetical protein
LLAGNAAFNPSSYESIATSTPSGVSTITFSSIPATYSSLQIRAIAKRDTAGASGSTNLRFNGDTAANYVRHYLRGDGATVSIGNSLSQTSIECFEHTGNSGVTNMMGVLILDIQDYASTTKYKVIRSASGNDQNGAGNIYLTSGLWLSTSAVTSITLFSSANYLQTTFALYGIKGA